MLQLSMNRLEDGKEFHFPSWWKISFVSFTSTGFHSFSNYWALGQTLSLNPHSTTLRLVFYYCFTAKERASHQEHTGPACPILAHAIFKWAGSKSPTRGLSVLVVSDFLNLQLSLPYCQSSLLLSPTFYANEFWEERCWDCHQMPLDTSYLGSSGNQKKRKRKLSDKSILLAVYFALGFCFGIFKNMLFYLNYCDLQV